MLALSQPLGTLLLLNMHLCTFQLLTCSWEDLGRAEVSSGERHLVSDRQPQLKPSLQLSDTATSADSPRVRRLLKVI